MFNIFKKKIKIKEVKHVLYGYIVKLSYGNVSMHRKRNAVDKILALGLSAEESFNLLYYGFPSPNRLRITTDLQCQDVGLLQRLFEAYQSDSIFPFGVYVVKDFNKTLKGGEQYTIDGKVSEEEISIIIKGFELAKLIGE